MWSNLLTITSESGCIPAHADKYKTTKIATPDFLKRDIGDIQLFILDDDSNI